EENDVGLLTASRTDGRSAGGAVGPGQRVDVPVAAEERGQAGEIGFKGIEEREGLGGADKVVVAAEAEGVFADGDIEVVHEFETRFAVEVGVAAVDAGGKGVGKLQVRLRGDGGEVEGAARKLNAQLVDHPGVDHRSQRSGNRLVAIEVVFERGRQVESVVE